MHRSLKLKFGTLIAVMAIGSGIASADPITTKTHIFQAFSSSGTPTLNISKHVNGSCFSGAESINRNDAWRCMSNNILYDPCFSSSNANGYVLCVANPWSSSAVKLHLTNSLPQNSANKHKPSTAVRPWGIKTVAGLKCRYVTGATTTIGGRRANYACKHSNTWLWGAPFRNTEPWKIYAAPLNASKLKHKARIAIAWF
jgi:hypothetical protein